MRGDGDILTEPFKKLPHKEITPEFVKDMGAMLNDYFFSVISKDNETISCFFSSF